MSHRVDSHGIVYDHPTQRRIGVVDKAGRGIVLDEDVYRDGGRYADEHSYDVLERVADINANIGPLVLDLLADTAGDDRVRQLRELGKHLHTLSGECLTRADEADAANQAEAAPAHHAR